MPVPVHARLRISGLLYGDALWSVSMALAGAGGEDPFGTGIPDVEGALQDWANAVQALNGGQIFGGKMQMGLSTDGSIETVRAARIGTDGKETEVALNTLGVPVKGQGSSLHDVQTAIVASLRTGRPGGSNRGRMYLPAIGVSVSGGRLGGAPSAAELATDVAGWLHDVCSGFPRGAGFTPALVPVIASRTKDALTAVTEVAVGDRLDSQRRRRGGEDEVYSTAAIAS